MSDTRDTGESFCEKEKKNMEQECIKYRHSAPSNIPSCITSERECDEIYSLVLFGPLEDEKEIKSIPKECLFKFIVSLKSGPRVIGIDKREIYCWLEANPYTRIIRTGYGDYVISDQDIIRIYSRDIKLSLDEQKFYDKICSIVGQYNLESGNENKSAYEKFSEKEIDDLLYMGAKKAHVTTLVNMLRSGIIVGRILGQIPLFVLWIINNDKGRSEKDIENILNTLASTLYPFLPLPQHYLLLEYALQRSPRYVAMLYTVGLGLPIDQLVQRNNKCPLSQRQIEKIIDAIGLCV